MTNLNANIFFESVHYPATPEDIAPVIVASNLKTPENIGHLIRIAGNTGCRKVILLNTGEQPRESKIKQVADVAGKKIEWFFSDLNDFQKHIPENFTLVALETISGSKNLFTTKLPEKMALIVGNEINGISPQLLQLATLSIHIPATGPIKSLNVSHATALCLFEWVKQHVMFPE